ncbi:MAG: SUMF1/EgtB/PvdO family nonheme iron enzyme [Nitrospira sp.]|nr:SUMF1/EgtB/PvdO family nonheme iron enzyme [Nitrospira sp.]
MSSIFLSHSSKDNGIAQQLKARLEQWGHRSIFLDFDPADGIPAGRDWEKELYAKLRECRAVIVLWSHASMASRWCFAEMAHAKALGKEVFPIKIDDAKVDPILTGKQIIDATTRWDEAYQRLEKGLLAAGLDPKDLFDWDSRRPPYPGLPAFQEQDAAIFFGRDKEIREGLALLNRLRQFGGPRLTLMLGASGSGKSSLMRAGLLPRLKRDLRWIVVEPFRPLKTPFDELARVLTERFSRTTQEATTTPTEVAHVRDQITWQEHETKKSVDAFLALIKTLRETSGSREATVLLMIDQCEELLTIGANEDGERFLAFLRSVLDCEDSHLLVLATLRSDFLGSFQDHPAMRGLRVEPFTVPQMEVDEFTSVIEGPARIAGLELGTGLVPAMISDTKTADALPLLAFTLRELYEGFGEDKLLTLEEYRDKLGRLDGCIARAAEAVLSAKPLSEENLSDLRNTFLSMVRINDKDQYAKQPVPWKDLPASAHDVLERFVSARLLISGGDGKGRTLEVAHEALFRAWPKLAKWIGDDLEELFVLRRAEIDAGEWEGQGYDLKYLWHADRLKQLQEIVARRGEKSIKELVRRFMSPQDKLCECLENTSLSHQDRFTIGQFLATVGDTRPGVGLNQDGLPDILWIDIPEVQGNLERIDHVGSKIKGFFELLLRRRSGRQTGNADNVFKVKPFRIAKYPVTNLQFESFLNAEDGFGNKEWWYDVDKIDRVLKVDPRWLGANAPRENVSRYEAVAFCRWLSSRTSSKIRLPTDWEWQQAATGGDPKREYPWEGGWDASRCNGSESRLKRTTAVGMYPHGATQQGVLDMAGNVWEWCQGSVVCGGSWYNNTGLLRAPSRASMGDQALRLNFQGTLGFRLVQDLGP